MLLLKKENQALCPFCDNQLEEIKVWKQGAETSQI